MIGGKITQKLKNYIKKCLIKYLIFIKIYYYFLAHFNNY